MFRWIAVAFAACLLVQTSAAEDPSLLSALTDRYDTDHFRRCHGAPDIVLNEVCAVGTECHPDVRISDFVEVYNGSSSPIDLACYVVANDMGIAFSPDGELPPRGVKAWGERDLDFRLKKSDDAVTLYRLVLGSEEEPALEKIDALTIRDSQAHSARMPDGGDWTHRSVSDAEKELRTTFGESNRSRESEASEGAEPNAP